VSANHNEEENKIKCACLNIENSLHVHMSIDMKCWNNLDKNEFWPKGNDDIMQCVTCSKSSYHLKTNGMQIV